MNRDDSFIVSPFLDAFQFIPNVPYSIGRQVLGVLNAGPFQKRSDLSTQNFGFTPVTGEACPDGMYFHPHKTMKRRDTISRGLNRRRGVVISPGYTTAGKADSPYSAILFFTKTWAKTHI